MRRLVPLLLLLAPIAVFGLTASALGQQDVDTVPTETLPRDQDEADEEEFGRDFEDRDARQDSPPEEAPTPDEGPAEGPAAPAQPSTPAADPPPPARSGAPLPRTGADARVLLATAYWLLLGGVALRRVTSLR